MAAIALRLCLILTLVLNGITAPLAMARMNHAMPPATAQSAEHAHHAGHAMPDDRNAVDDSCCQGGVCECGCVLPPAMAFALPHLLAAAPMLAPDSPFVTRFAPPHTTPPFRPPAV